MAGNLITPCQRSLGWNIQIVTSSHQTNYCGLYIPLKNEKITFRDLLHELRYCFEFPLQISQEISLCLYDIDSTWADVQYWPGPRMMSESLRNLDTTIPGVMPGMTVKYDVKNHKTSCQRNQDAALGYHEGCLSTCGVPMRQSFPSYLPLPMNNNPRRDELVPADMTLAEDQRVQAAMNSFQGNVETASFCCAVTKQGRPWYNANIGPAMKANHIIAPEHYRLYPTDPYYEGLKSRHTIEVDRCCETWSAGNGVVLLSHLRELFDARVFSIHYATLQIRVFLPCDVVEPYHGALATLSRRVDRKALMLHWKMCRIENMAAIMPPDAPLHPVLPGELAEQEGMEEVETDED